MARFQGLVDLIFEFDQDDIDKSRHLFYLATGGRSEEVFAYFHRSKSFFVSFTAGPSIRPLFRDY